MSDAHKPKLIIVEARNRTDLSETPIERARQRFGQPFAHEPGTRWKPRETLYLTEWLSNRTRGKK